MLSIRRPKVIQLLDKLKFRVYSLTMFATKEIIASDETPTYNVKAAAQLTGISAVTLRAWERRYGMPSPQRGTQGYRLYSEHDLRTLHWLKAQLATGLSISRAASRLTELRSSGRDPAASPTELETSNLQGDTLQIGDLAPSVTIVTTTGQPYALQNAWQTSPVLLVFLRHFGCIFCRELLGKLEQHQVAIIEAGLKLVVIGLGDPDQAQQVCGQLVPNAVCLSNKSGEAYTAYGFKTGSLMQLAGPQVMSSAVRAARAGYFQGETTGDISQLGGLFVVDQSGYIRLSFYSRYAGDQPDLTTILESIKNLK